MSVGRESEDMKGYLAIRNQANCVDHWNLTKSVWDKLQ